MVTKKVASHLIRPVWNDRSDPEHVEMSFVRSTMLYCAPTRCRTDALDVKIYKAGVATAAHPMRRCSSDGQPDLSDDAVGVRSRLTFATRGQENRWV